MASTSTRLTVSMSVYNQQQAINMLADMYADTYMFMLLASNDMYRNSNGELVRYRDETIERSNDELNRLQSLAEALGLNGNLLPTQDKIYLVEDNKKLTDAEKAELIAIIENEDEDDDELEDEIADMTVELMKQTAIQLRRRNVNRVIEYCRRLFAWNFEAILSNAFGVERTTPSGKTLSVPTDGAANAKRSQNNKLLRLVRYLGEDNVLIREEKLDIINNMSLSDEQRTEAIKQFA